jgi:hypothetical protein
MELFWNFSTSIQFPFSEGFSIQSGAYGHRLYSGCDDETAFLLEMRDNICYYAEIIDTYAPCIVGSSRWNNIVNMENHCATTDRKVWSKKVLSISDEAFILLCLLNYGKRWFAELIKVDKMVRNEHKWLCLYGCQNCDQATDLFFVN